MPQTCSGSVISSRRVRPQRGLVALLVGLALSLSVVSRGQAATTWTVCASGCDYASIKAAIAAPTTVDGDTLAIAAGTYTEAGITVSKSLTLQGEDAATTIVQAADTHGTASNRVFLIPSGAAVTMQKLTIRHGRASGDFGGGLYNEGTLTLTNSTIRDNSAHYTGGGVFNDGTLTLLNSTVRSNTAYRVGGGGLFNYYGRTLTLTNSTVSDNSAGSNGGGLWNDDGTVTLTNSTVSDNSAPYGGGLFNNGPLSLTQSTVSGNAATFPGAGLDNVYGTVTLTNSIVAHNLGGGNCRNNDSIRSHGYNLDSDGSCFLTAPTDRPGVDPRLGPLQDNGGPTFTQALLPGSPAIDAIPWGVNGCGTILVSDQRWQVRPQPVGGACDIGAYEVGVAGQALSGWVTGFTPHTVVCQNVTTGHAVTLSNPVSPWDCEAAGLEVSPGDQVALRVRGLVKRKATDVGGAVAGMTPRRGTCTNVTTGQQVTFPYTSGATAASCGAAGLVVQAGDHVQLRVQGGAE
jgi:hypothetical protein